ncbi:MAG: CBS domain-containing protein [Gemmataceae bacterium]|nr:CBS domain-containing protein [Gemmataceae bacterium]MDW8266221.1 CBS domain-containing protein [Gemmataceae bacterium]
MATTTKSLLSLTANDLMTRELVLLTEDMPLREAARRLLHHQVSGAPVVDARGRCVGVLSSTDFLRLAEKRRDVEQPTAPALPQTCSFQERYRRADGREVTACTLPSGVCPMQRLERDAEGLVHILCHEPHCVPVDWQIVPMEQLPTDEVRCYMTPNPVTIPADATLRTMARAMIDGHIHRLIVVDEHGRPIGIVSSTDLLAAVAYAEDDDWAVEPAACATLGP